MRVKEVHFIRGTTLGISNTGPGKEKKNCQGSKEYKVFF